MTNELTKKLVFFSAGLLIFIMIGGVVFVLAEKFSSQNVISNNQPVDSSEKISDTAEKTSLIPADIISKIQSGREQNSSACEQLADAYFRDQCYVQFAKTNQKMEICRLVISLPDKNACELSVAKSLAIASGDIGICDQISNPLIVRRCIRDVKTASALPADSSQR